MCRILFLKGKNKEKALEYLDAFHNAGCNDPHLEYTATFLKVPKIKNKHIHGWGYLLVTEYGVNTYLNGQAFYDDEFGFNNLKNQIEKTSGEFMLMAELRVTDQGHVSALNSHPFNYITKNGYEGYLFYNGLLDYSQLAKLEGVDYLNYEKKNGTLVMGLSIAAELERGTDIKNALQAPKKALKSGYNLMSFVHTNLGEHKAFINAYAVPELLEDEKVFAYYKLIKKEENDMVFAGSSVIGEYMKDDFKNMENGELLEFDIDFIKEFYFDAYDGKE